MALAAVTLLLAPVANGAAASPSTRDITAIDVATAAGIGQITQTWSAPVGDVDPDGHQDFFLSRHLGGPGSLYRNKGDGTFSEIDVGNFPKADRLGCAFADVDLDGRQDLFCAIGDNKSTAMNPSELWMQQQDGTFLDEAEAYGVTDPLGRERWPVFFDANNDGYPDLFVGVQYPRLDGQDESNHLYLNQAGTSYLDVPSYGLDTTSGEVCASAGDFNGDGWVDLLVCGQDYLRLYRNDGGLGFTDVTQSAGLGRAAWSDAKLVDMNGDGLADIVEVKKGKTQTRFSSGTTFRPAVLLATLTQGLSVATGDVDGNGTNDVYVVQTCPRNSTTDSPDLMFLNNGDGTFTQVDTPQATSGCGDVASAIDYDGDGMADFLVLNGAGSANGRWISGPVQLLTFATA
jgi:enediyne biosynthesis protein E4